LDPFELHCPPCAGPVDKAPSIRPSRCAFRLVHAPHPPFLHEMIFFFSLSVAPRRVGDWGFRHLSTLSFVGTDLFRSDGVPPARAGASLVALIPFCAKPQHSVVDFPPLVQSPLVVLEETYQDGEGSPDRDLMYSVSAQRRVSFSRGTRSLRFLYFTGRPSVAWPPKFPPSRLLPLTCRFLGRAALSLFLLLSVSLFARASARAAFSSKAPRRSSPFLHATEGFVLH